LSTSSNGTQIRGYKGKLVDLNYVKLLLGAGCSWCDGDMSVNDQFSWLDDSSVVCKKCLNGSHHAPEEKKPTLMLTDKQREQLNAAIKAKEIGNGISVKKGQKS
jgi:hypothetical protein